MQGHWRSQSNFILHTMRPAAWMFLVVCLLLAQTLHSQEKEMHHYVLLFRPTRSLTPDELKQRGVEITAWVKRVKEMGITVEPKALGQFAVRFSQQNGSVVSQEGSADPSLTNLVFFDAASQEQAIEVARLHPATHYGTAEEVREWTSPVAAAPVQK
jgi:hypothetical protein